MACQLAQNENNVLWPLYIKRNSRAEKYEMKALQDIHEWLAHHTPAEIKPIEYIPAVFPPSDLKKKYPKGILDQIGYIGREAFLVSIGLQYCAIIGGGSEKVFSLALGSLGEDLFPHNSKMYWNLLNQLFSIEMGKFYVPIINPLQDGDLIKPCTKKDVLMRSRILGLPVDLTRSCISEHQIPCGYCAECKQRIIAEEQLNKY
jgi:hypothetical protein